MLRDNLKRLREESGMTQEELAGRLHVVRQTVSKWEKGTSVPDADLLVSMAEVFAVTPNELLAPAAIQAADVESLALQTGLLSEQIDQQRRRFTRTLRIALAVLVAVAIAAVVLVSLNDQGFFDAPEELPNTDVVTYTLDNKTPVKFRIYRDSEDRDTFSRYEGTPEAMEALEGRSFTTPDDIIDALDDYAESQGGRLLYIEGY